MTAQMLDCASPLTSDLVKQVKNSGYVAVGRYLNPISFKTLTPAEAKLITSGELGIVSIWESNPTYASYFTSAQGASDAQNAVKAAQSVGQPAGTPIYLTCDYAAQKADYNAIQAYINGALAHIAPYELGFYASYDVLSIVQGVKYLWQTVAWSHGQVLPNANLYQRTTDVTLFGHSFDVDDVLIYPGWWPTPKGISMQTIEFGAKGTEVEQLQQDLNKTGAHLVVDSDFGPATKAAVIVFQKDHKLQPDGIVGPLTWAALEAAIAPAPKPVPTPPPTPTPPPVVHNYTLVVQEDDSKSTGEWAQITIFTKDNGQPLGHQIVTIAENGVVTATDYTDDQTGGYGWAITETTDKVDTMTVTWVDPAGVTHTSTHTTTFTVPQTTDAPIPSDDNVVVRIPMLPDSDVSDAIFFNITAPNGQDIKVQLDTGAFELMFTTDSAKTLGLANEGALSVQGVGGTASAYYSHADFSINGVSFTSVPCVVEDAFQGLPLFGYKFFVDNGYDLLISQKHNQIVVMKGAN